jgi:uncharacterized protein YndB with AHSA1/START domain
MLRVGSSIEIPRPVNLVYARWLDVPSYPEFMADVADVRVVEGGRLRWTSAHPPRAWTATIVEDVPGRRIAWSGDGPSDPSGAVTLHVLGEERTLVVYQVGCAPERDEAAVRERLDGELERFAGHVARRYRADTAGAALEPGAMQPLVDLCDMDVLGSGGEPIGRVGHTYLDAVTGRVKYLTILLGWVHGGGHPVPAADARYNKMWRCLEVPYDRRQIGDAPRIGDGAELTPDDEERIADYYGRIDHWDARRAAIERRQEAPAPTPRIGALTGGAEGGAHQPRTPAPTPAIAEAEVEAAIGQDETERSHAPGADAGRGGTS